jgi:hypothetical protein
MNQKPQIYQAFQALLIAHHAIEAGQRHTGRTDFDVSQVGDREAIVCVKSERLDIERRCRELGKSVQVISVEPDDFLNSPGTLFRGSHDFRFSHGFLHALIELELRVGQRRLSKLLDQFQGKPKPVEEKKFSAQPSFHSGNGHFF